jgi:hypothetical protein
MSTMTGVAVCVPVALIDAAKETVGLFYRNPAERANLRAEFSGDGTAPATHYVGNWSVASDQFSDALSDPANLPIADYLAMLPEEERADALTRIQTALASFVIYDPDNLYQSAPTVDTWDATKINVIPIDTISGKAGLAAVGLVPVNLEV